MHKVKYYYIRNPKRVPVITVCLIQGDEGISRGVAICNLNLENPVKKEGRRLARNRALQAYVDKRSHYKIRQLLSIPRHSLYKAQFMPVLMDREKRLLRNHLLYRRF